MPPRHQNLVERSVLRGSEHEAMGKFSAVALGMNVLGPQKLIQFKQVHRTEHNLGFRCAVK